MSSLWDELDEEKRKTADYISLKEGEKIVMEIDEMFKDAYAKFKPKRKDGGEQAFAIVLRDKNGKTLTVGSFSLQRALQDARVNQNDRIEIDHPKRGVYYVRKVNQ